MNIEQIWADLGRELGEAYARNTQLGKQMEDALFELPTGSSTAPLVFQTAWEKSEMARKHFDEVRTKARRAFEVAGFPIVYIGQSGVILAGGICLKYPKVAVSDR